MVLSKHIDELIKLNYNTLSPVEFNQLFSLKGYVTIRETSIEKRIAYYKNKELQKEKYRLKRQENALTDPIKYKAYQLYHAAKARSKSKNIPFNLSLELIEEKMKTGKCECTGIEFYIKPYSKREEYVQINPHSPSIDRLIPELGYVDDNIQLVCDQFNKMKSDKTMEQTYFLARQFIKYQDVIEKHKMETV